MFMNFTRSALFSIVAIHRRKCNRLQCFHLKVPLEFLDNSILHTKVKKFMIIAKIRARGVPRVLRCEVIRDFFTVVYILCFPFRIIIINKIILSDATIRVLIFQRLL
jgi:AAA15 family ATPase/GTPase